MRNDLSFQIAKHSRSVDTPQRRCIQLQLLAYGLLTATFTGLCFPQDYAPSGERPWDRNWLIGDTKFWPPCLKLEQLWRTSPIHGPPKDQQKPSLKQHCIGPSLCPFQSSPSADRCILQKNSLTNFCTHLSVSESVSRKHKFKKKKSIIYSDYNNVPLTQAWTPQKKAHLYVRMTFSHQLWTSRSFNKGCWNN